jgi:CHAT domain-containing protein
VRRTPLFLLLALFAQAAGAESWRDTNAKFWKALQERDLIGLRASCAGTIFEKSRLPIRSVLNTFDFINTCVPETVSVKTGADEVVATIRLTGEGHLVGGSMGPLPVHWTLTFTRSGDDWRIAHVDLGEAVLAREIAKNPTVSAQAAFAAAGPGISRSVLVRVLPIYAMSNHDYHTTRALLDRCDEFTDNAAARAGIDVMKSEVERQNSHFEAAADWACRAMSEAQSIDNPDLMVRALIRTSAIERLQGQTDDAFEHIQMAEKLTPVCDDASLTTFVLLTEGAVAEGIGRRTQAIEYYERAGEASRANGWFEMAAIAEMNTGGLYVDLSYDDIAKRHLLRALDQFVAMGSPYNASVSATTIAGIEQRAGNLTEALAMARKALAFLGPEQHVNRVAALRAMASILVSQKREEEADQVIGQAIAEARKAAYGNLGFPLAEGAEISLRRSETDDAFARASEALQIALALKDDSLSFGANTTLGAVFIRRGQPEKARQALSDAIATSETLRSKFPGDLSNRASYFRDLTLPYERMIGLLAGQGKALDALRWSERKRARALLDGLATASSAPAASQSQRAKALDDQLNQLLQDLVASDATHRAEAQARLASARTDYEEFRASRYLHHPELVPAFDTVQRIDADAERLVANGSAVVEYAVVEDRVLAFAIRRGAAGGVDVKMLRLGAGYASLSKLIEQFAAKVSLRDLEYRPLSRRLYDAVLAPVEGLIDPMHTVCIIPDGALWRLPFGALLDKKGEFFGAGHAFHLASSLAVLRNTKSRRRTKPDSPSLVAFGDPRVSVRGSDFAPLPDADEEVHAIARLYRSSHVFTGSAASRDTALAEIRHAKVIHFATHAIVDDQHPMYSGLLLAGPDGQARILDGRDIGEMRIDAGIAVLSACDTGRGKISDGEGLIGLSWAFGMAGCPSTVVSQWKAASKPASEMMIEFHRRLLAGEAAPEALRGARVKMMGERGRTHPFYWASWVVIGAP